MDYTCGPILLLPIMKYSNYTGAVVAILLIGVCFAPWVYIESIHTTVSGLSAANTNFGLPGLINIVLAVIAIVLFILPTTWAKRLNLFAGAFNFAWSVRNYLLITQCEMGECPEKKWGIYALVLLSVLLLLLSFLPKIKVKD